MTTLTRGGRELEARTGIAARVASDVGRVKSPALASPAAALTPLDGLARTRRSAGAVRPVSAADRHRTRPRRRAALRAARSPRAPGTDRARSARAPRREGRDRPGVGRLRER